MGVGESVQRWLESDGCNSFYEFKCVATPETDAIFRNIDFVASKSYHASGIITVVIAFEGCFYVTVSDGQQENPLLDSKFPDGLWQSSEPIILD